MVKEWTPAPERSRWQQRRRLEVAPDWVALRDEQRLLISSTRLSELLGVTKMQINTLRLAGRLPVPVRLAGSVRWSVKAIRQWAAPIASKSNTS